ncbi:hypothetical protein QYF36_021728 [Acer negundo]|nr:hypothetical protein QYF36_021728 [Acer negundo]
MTRDSSFESSYSKMDEGQLEALGHFKGECSKFKGMGKLPNVGGPQKESKFSNPSDRANPKSILVSILGYKDRRLFSVPLRGPIQLPLNGLEGGQIIGKDLHAVPLAVELEGEERSPSSSSSSIELEKSIRTKNTRVY